MSETDGNGWEVRLRELLKGILSRRLDPLASELNSLQNALDALRGRLVEEAREVEREAAEAVSAEVRNQREISERSFAGERELLRGEYVRSARTERALLNSVIADIDRQRTQAGVLAATILGASGFASRVALFVVRSGSIIGWRGAGFGQGADEASMALLSAPLADRNLLSDAINARQSMLNNGSGDPDYLSFLGVHRISGISSAAVPLIVRDKPAAILYADTSLPDGIDVQPLEAIVRVASMAIELLPLRRSTEPFTTELPAPKVLTASLDHSSLAVSDDTDARGTAPLTPPPVHSEVPAEAITREEVPEALEPRETQSEKQASASDIGSNGHLASTGAASISGEQASIPSHDFEPQIEAAPAREFSTADSTDPRSHLNARRYARFLIGQIKLYQPSRVAEGCRKGDLYDRLREEIESSRKLYERHVPDPITAEFDYFYHELVINLAEGDATKLGRNFPSQQTD